MGGGRQAIQIILLLGGLMLAACGQGVALDRLPSIGQGRVLEVPAGDALVLEGGRRVKLAGITAPAPGQPYGDAARAALDQIALGQTVELLASGAQTDPYGRTLAQARLTKSRAWLQGRLLSTGAVRVRTYADNHALAADMLTLEGQARGRKRGLWALPAYQVRLPQEVDPAERGFLIVEGRVDRVAPLGGGYALDLREASRTVRLRVPPEALAAFQAAGLDPASLAARLVRVRGAPRYDGSLWLDHPASLELVRAH